MPHRKTYVIDRTALLEIVDAGELGFTEASQLPATAILLARPDPEKLAALPRAMALVRTWRQLFHAAVHRELSRRCLDVPSRIQRIGEVEFEEIRSVLAREKYLLPPRDAVAVYVEFVAVYLELRHFAPRLLPHCFPALTNFDAIDLLLADDVEAAALLSATRLPGAPLQPALMASFEDEASGEDSEPAGARADDRRANEGEFHRLTQRAESAAQTGNVVRAALESARAARVARRQRADEARDAVSGCLQQLVRRLQAALELGDQEAGRWRQALLPLLEPASRGLWPPEARALYDLQKVCIDHERAIHAVDLVEWARTLGRRPLKRPLPGQREWLIVKHLRSAEHRLRTARLSDKRRRTLLALLLEAIHRAEEQLRDFFRPRVRTALSEVGLVPGNYPERIALLKLVEEVLDRIVATGYLTIGDLRDAVSRNNLKLADLGGPIEFLAGDRLLRLDQRLALHLDGVYRRGEIYLRWMQRLTALAFGNGVGRFLTLYVLLPFGGSWGVLETIQHVVHPLAHYFEWGDIHLDDSFSIIVLGVLLLLLINLATARRMTWQGLAALSRGIKSLVFDLPAFVLNHPWLRAIFESSTVQFSLRFAIKPGLLMLPVTAALLITGQSGYATVTWSAVAFLAANWALNSRLGRNLEEIALDWLLHNWERITVDLLPGLFRFVWDLFKSGLETIDRLLYSVDEWLRFRSGEGWAGFSAKLVLGFFWFWITYFLRLLINVFIEPHFNPIKHFPAVTIGAKLLLPFWIPLTLLFAYPLEPFLGKILATSMAQFPVWMLPGVFGFLVWEMQANWRLYAANRPKTLQAVVIGSHGETLRRLLRPGFHSGTIPKLFARLRRAERRAVRYAVWRSPEKYQEELHHVEESLRHFIDREFVTLLNGSRRWQLGALSVGVVRLATNCVRIELTCQDTPAALRLLLAEQAGFLVARVEQAGWSSDLTAGDLEALRAALIGLYLLAGIDLAREQLALALPEQLNAVQVSWDEWVEVWEADQMGKGRALRMSPLL